MYNPPLGLNGRLALEYAEAACNNCIDVGIGLVCVSFFQIHVTKAPLVFRLIELDSDSSFAHVGSDINS